MEIAHKFGADALRLYLVNSPAVRAENLRFKEDGVRDVVKDVFLPWYNAYRFLMQNVERLERVSSQKLYIFFFFFVSELTLAESSYWWEFHTCDCLAPIQILYTFYHTPSHFGQVVDQFLYLAQSCYASTGPTSLSTDLYYQASGRVAARRAIFWSHWYDTQSC